MTDTLSRGFDPIRKPDHLDPPPNLPAGPGARAAFSWSAMEAALDGLPHGGGLNLAHEAVDRHATGSNAERVALRWLSRRGDDRVLTYADLARASSRFANVLEGLEVRSGERVVVLLERVPEFYVAALGTLKYGAVVCPLFSAYGPEPVRRRIALVDGRVLVTSPRLYAETVAQIRGDLPGLEHLVLVDAAHEPFPSDAPPDVHDWFELMAGVDDAYTIAPTDPESMALLHVTSGTTDTPKGVIHVHAAAVHHYMTGLYALDFRPGDVFWCTADPGWATGTSYGLLAPLIHGITNLVDEAEFEAERCYAILQDQKVDVWYTTPTVLRMLRKAGSELARRYDLSQLRFVASGGEPLAPDVVVWGHETFGVPVHDTWWQTETGGIMIANTRAADVTPGAMGRPLPGVEAGIVDRTDGHVREIRAADTVGELALRPGWPSMFRGYLNRTERYRNAFVDGWYLTGDLATRDVDGAYRFVGRADDLIKSAGHLIGPFEVESALLDHPAVAEAGVIGVPDPVLGEVVRAFVTLHAGVADSADLRLELLRHARARLGPAVAPTAVEVRDRLPHTPTGAILRRLLKARELDLPEGESPASAEASPGEASGSSSRGT